MEGLALASKAQCGMNGGAWRAGCPLSVAVCLERAIFWGGPRGLMAAVPDEYYESRTSNSTSLPALCLLSRTLYRLFYLLYYGDTAVVEMCT